MYRKLFLGLSLLVIISIGILHGYDYRPLVKRLIVKTVERNSSAVDVDPDTVEILFCGTGSPNRNPYRASPCLALIAYGKLYLFDAGEGAIAKLYEYQAPVLRLEKVFLTHLHSDHMSGVAEVLHNTWLYGRQQSVELVGPPGTENLLDGMRLSYGEDIKERMHVLGPDGVSMETAFPAAREVRVQTGKIQIVHEDKDLTIEAFPVLHPHWDHAYGYRISVAGKSIVVSGDTRPSESVRTYAENSDYLIHEAFNRDMMSKVGETLEQINVPISAARIERIGDVHTDTIALAKLAQQSKTQHLVLTHLIPPVPDTFPARRAFMSGMSEYYSGRITMAYDGMRISLN